MNRLVKIEIRIDDNILSHGVMSAMYDNFVDTRADGGFIEMNDDDTVVEIIKWFHDLAALGVEPQHIASLTFSLADFDFDDQKQMVEAYDLVGVDYGLCDSATGTLLTCDDSWLVLLQRICQINEGLKSNLA